MKKAIFSLLIILASLSAVCQTVLSDGHWHRLATDRDGIYCISYQKIRQLGFPEPDKVRIFGNSMGMLPLMNGEPRPDDLRECGIFRFNNCIYFYAHGAHTWRYDSIAGINVCTQNLYTDKGCYFITDIDSKVNNSIQGTSAESFKSTETQGFFTYHHEEMLQNIQMSGRRWFGEHFANSGTLQVKFECNSVPDNNATISAGLASRSAQSQKFIISLSDSKKEITLKGVSDSGPYADALTETFSLKTQNSTTQTINVEFRKTEGSSAAGYLDFITIQTLEPLTYSKKQISFESVISTPDGVKYIVEGLSENHLVMDVTDTQPVMLKSGKGYFISQGEGRRKFAISAPDHALEPEYLGDVPNQNLHSLSHITYLIVCKPEMRKYAEQIAQMHPEQKAYVATDQEIYNEFSSGMRDVAAIRDFTRHLYNKDGTLKYLLLFGDGSVDNLHDTPGNTNVLPTYQSENSLNENGMQSFVSDDFFGLLGHGEGEYIGDLDIGVGRIPVKDEHDAEVAVSKLREYLSADDCTPWRRNVLLLADDENYNLHAQQTDHIAENIEDSHGEFNVIKMFMDSYRQESSAVGDIYPTATKALLQQIEDGVLVFNYIGHGGMRYFADERILTIDDIDALRNLKRLPIVVTASCNIGHFDHYNAQTDKASDSPAERLLLNSNGGAIAMLTTTREVLANQNFTLCKNVFDLILEKGATLGDVVRMAKNKTNDLNKLNFVLLGDPALPVRRAEFDVEVESVAGLSDPDDKTLRAMQTYTIDCRIERPELFASGTAFVEIKDKRALHRTLNNDGEGAFEYQDFGNSIFKGKSSVRDGRFSVTFTVPKDIDYRPGAIKISLYACNGQHTASGFCKSLNLNGSATEANTDKIGPQIAISVSDGVMRLALSDDSGINVTGTPGHRIILETDGETIDLTPYYEPDIDSHTSGKVEFMLGALPEGIHNIRVKAWDNMNNLSERVFTTAVTDDKALRIYNLRNYPNPFSDETTVSFAHNSYGTADYTIRIVDANGRLVFSKSGTLSLGDGTIALSNSDIKLNISGMYFYQLEIRDSEGRVARESKKLLYIK